MSHETPVQPKLGDLLARYLEKQAEACAVGAAASADEVTPYEAGPVQPINPKLAWDEALAVFSLAGTTTNVRGWKAPPQWSSMVTGHEPVLALALCAANFPQMVRNFHMILQTENLTTLKPQAGRPIPASDLLSWADDIGQRGQMPQLLLALGALRLAKQLDVAEQFVRKHDAKIPAEWRGAWENEKAALAWHSGRAAEALASWQKQEPTAVVLFNRGMAELFLGKASAAREHLSAAVAQLPESSAWHHLGRLYLTLAQGR
jgi:hypothetical protein